MSFPSTSAKIEISLAALQNRGITLKSAEHYKQPSANIGSLWRKKPNDFNSPQLHILHSANGDMEFSVANGSVGYSTYHDAAAQSGVYKTNCVDVLMFLGAANINADSGDTMMIAFFLVNEGVYFVLHMATNHKERQQFFGRIFVDALERVSC